MEHPHIHGKAMIVTRTGESLCQRHIIAFAVHSLRMKVQTDPMIVLPTKVTRHVSTVTALDAGRR